MFFECCAAHGNNQGTLTLGQSLQQDLLAVVEAHCVAMPSGIHAGLDEDHILLGAETQTRLQARGNILQQ